MYYDNNVTADILAKSTFALKVGDDTTLVVTTTNSNGDLAIASRSKLEFQLAIQTKDAADASAIATLQTNRTQYAASLTEINALQDYL